MAEVFYGLGRHLHYLSPYQYAHYLKFDYLDWIQVFVTLAVSKISICQFLLRLSKFDRLRRFLQVLVAIIILTHVPLTLLMIFQCNPVQKYWDQTLPGSCFSKKTVERIIISQGGMYQDSVYIIVADSFSNFHCHRFHRRCFPHVPHLECRYQIME